MIKLKKLSNEEKFKRLPECCQVKKITLEAVNAARKLINHS